MLVHWLNVTATVVTLERWAAPPLTTMGFMVKAANSKAPMSGGPEIGPADAALVGGEPATGTPASMAGLPGSRAMVIVGPPLSCNGPSIGSTFEQVGVDPAGAAVRVADQVVAERVETAPEPSSATRRRNGIPGDDARRTGSSCRRCSCGCRRPGPSQAELPLRWRRAIAQRRQIRLCDAAA